SAVPGHLRRISPDRSIGATTQAAFRRRLRSVRDHCPLLVSRGSARSLTDVARGTVPGGTRTTSTMSVVQLAMPVPAHDSADLLLQRVRVAVRNAIVDGAALKSSA